MHLRAAFTVAIGAVGLMGSAHGYLIDPDSCKGDNFNFVKDMVEQAFKMANLAVEQTQGDTMNDDAAWLLKQLFNLEGTAAKGLVKDAFVASEPNNKGDRTGILAFKDEKTGSLDALDQNEVVIFCDTSRLERRAKDPLHYYDNKAKEAVGMTDGCGGAFMYTQAWAKHWDVIQVCPWFLEYATAKKYRTNADTTTLKAFLAAKGLDDLITDRVYTPIDLLALWDKSMLHEFMHTKAGSTKEDVGGFGGYGWKNCKGMAGDGRGQTNADSYALFGSALYWFNQGSPIDENGNFKNEVPSDATKRRWVGSGAVRAAEALQA